MGFETKSKQYISEGADMGKIIKYFDVDLTASDSGGDNADDITTSISINLDSSANDEKTAFAPGDTVFFQITRNPLDTYTVESNGGKVRSVGKNIPSPVSKTLKYTKTDTASLPSTPQEGSLSYAWQSLAPICNITAAGRVLSLSTPSIGALDCEYNILTDTWSLSGVAEEGTVILVAEMGDEKDSLEVVFSNDNIDPEEPDTEISFGLQVLFCDDNSPAPGVQVYLDGKLQGITGADGIVDAGIRKTGSLLDLRMTGGTGENAIIPSDQDSIENDSITV